MPSETPRACYPDDFVQRLADFGTLSEALDYAALSGTGMNFYGVNGKLETQLTYAAIRVRARELAARLLSLGLSRGDRIGIVADMHPDFVTLFLACQYAGYLAVPLPVITGLGGRQGYLKQLARVLETSGARAAFSLQDTLEYVKEAAIGLPNRCHNGRVQPVRNCRQPGGITALKTRRTKPYSIFIGQHPKSAWYRDQPACFNGQRPVDRALRRWHSEGRTHGVLAAFLP